MSSQEELEKTILDVIYKSSDSLISSYLSRNGVIQDVLERREDINKTDVEYQLAVLEEDGLVQRDKGTVQMGWRGLERYEELGGTTNLDEELQEEILESLLDEKKSDPKHPYKAKEDLIADLEIGEEIVTENVWILREVGYVELRQALGSDYLAAAITEMGRRTLEQTQMDTLRDDDQGELEEIIEQEVQRRLQERSPSEQDKQSKDPEEVDSDVEDAFICHASEDKDDFVEPLAEELQEMGLDVWYDEFRLEVGDSIRREIEKGLANSRYGIVIISEYFFEKEWPQRELDTLADKEIGGQKVVLPVWYEVDREFVEEYSPTLATKYAIRANSEDVLEVAEELYSAIEE